MFDETHKFPSSALTSPTLRLLEKLWTLENEVQSHVTSGQVQGHHEAVPSAKTQGVTGCREKRVKFKVSGAVSGSTLGTGKTEVNNCYAGCVFIR